MELRALRSALGATQGDLADAYGATQARISDLENDRAPLSAQLEYREFLRGRLSNPASAPIVTGLRDFRSTGPRLFDDPSMRGLLPESWTLIGTSRIATKYELAFLFDQDEERYGLSAYYRKPSGELKRTRVIPFDGPYYQYAVAGLLRFLTGTFPIPVSEDAFEGFEDDGNPEDGGIVEGSRQRLKPGGWDEAVLDIIRRLSDDRFNLEHVYQYTSELGRRFPRHKDLKSGIRFTLQRLRDKGYIEFLGHGNYRRNAS